MESLFSEQILKAYNPWWDDGTMGNLKPPEFRRLVFNRLYKSIKGDRRIIILTGPRRVGKTTLIRQIIQKLLEDGINPHQIVSFAMDDPSVLSTDPEQILERLVGPESVSKQRGNNYVFLDEVQYLNNWERYLKRYYDLNWPVKFVVSGSAATPIFRASRESLLGRSIDFELPPFTFVEFIGFDNPIAYNNLLRRDIKPDFKKDLSNIIAVFEVVKPVYDLYEDFVREFFINGGFPEAWEINDPTEKTEYIINNQVDKVIFDDLALTEDVRKPESLKKLCYALYTNPGRESNLTRLSQELGINRNTIDLYLSLMERTTLISKLNKLRYGRTSLKRSNFKTYIADLSLRNAILQIRSIEDLPLEDMGYYAENAVFNVLKRRKDITEISYYRSKNGKEVDFVIDIGVKKLIPIEVKYHDRPITKSELRGLYSFINEYKPEFSVIVTKREHKITDSNIVSIPLNYLLIFFEREAYETL